MPSEPGTPSLRVVSALWRHMVTSAERPLLILERGRTWKDGNFRTRFTAVLRLSTGDEKELGVVKVLQRGLERATPPVVPCARLGDDFCSLGQSIDYYECIGSLDPALAIAILTAIRDIAHDEAADEALVSESGRAASLFRSPEAEAAYAFAKERFRSALPRPRAPEARASRVRSTLRFIHRLDGFDSGEQRLQFEFSPAFEELGRVCVLAGPNATGKTRLLRALSKCASGMREENTIDYKFDAHVHRVLVVTYCTLDEQIQGFHRWRTRYDSGVAYHHCGFDLRAGMAPDIERTLTRACQHIGEYKERQSELWRELVGECDVLLGESVTQRIQTGQKCSIEEIRRLSAGQKVIFLFLSQVIHAIRPHSLLLIDEPENHLHPEALSFVLRALRRILREYESFAIVSTHSPLVLQETPGRAVTLIQRDDASVRSFSYPGESFGASLNEIMTLAFGISEHGRNYMKYLVSELEREGEHRIEGILKTGDASTAVLATLERAREERE